MARVRFTKAFGEFAKGDEAEVSEARANRLRSIGAIETATTPSDVETAARTDAPQSNKPALVVDYEELTKAELEEEVESRELTVKGTGAEGNVLKADLVKALKKSDRA